MVYHGLNIDVLAKIIKKISVGSKVIDICVFGDMAILEELNKYFNKKPVFKGIAFPTCISVNEICGYNSPLPEDSTSIKEGDLVKIELGAHVDGFAGFAGHTIVVQSDAKAAVTGKQADVILAAYKATQAALRVIKPGNFNNKVTEVISKCCEAYGVNAVEGVLSHDIKKHLIDGNKVILNKETFDQRVDDQEFAVHDIIVLDVFVSSGEGKPKEVFFYLFRSMSELLSTRELSIGLTPSRSSRADNSSTMLSPAILHSASA